MFTTTSLRAALHLKSKYFLYSAGLRSETIMSQVDSAREQLPPELQLPAKATSPPRQLLN